MAAFSEVSPDHDWLQDADKLKEIFTAYKERKLAIGGFTLWAPSTVYAAGTVRANEGTVYFCKSAHTSGASFDPNYWKEYMVAGSPAAWHLAHQTRHPDVSAQNAYYMREIMNWINPACLSFVCTDPAYGGYANVAAIAGQASITNWSRVYFFDSMGLPCNGSYPYNCWPYATTWYPTGVDADPNSWKNKNAAMFTVARGGGFHTANLTWTWAGTICGPWVYYFVQEAFKRMIWTQSVNSRNTEDTRWKVTETGHPDCATARAAAVANWPDTNDATIYLYQFTRQLSAGTWTAYAVKGKGSVDRAIAAINTVAGGTYTLFGEASLGGLAADPVTLDGMSFADGLFTELASGSFTTGATLTTAHPACSITTCPLDVAIPELPAPGTLECPGGVETVFCNISDARLVLEWDFSHK